MKSDREISEHLGISSRTVKRRLTRMVKGGAITRVASLNVEALKDCLYADLTVSVKKPELRAETENEILSLVEEYLIFNGHFVEYSALNLILPNVPSARKVLESVRRLEGVKAARIDFVEERFESYDILSAQVKRKIAEMDTYN